MTVVAVFSESQRVNVFYNTTILFLVALRVALVLAARRGRGDCPAGPTASTVTVLYDVITTRTGRQCELRQ